MDKGENILSRNRAAKAQTKRMNQVVENTIAFNQQATKTAQRRVDLIPRTRNQERLVFLQLLHTLAYYILKLVSIEGFEPSPHAPKAWTLPGYAIRSSFHFLI